MNSNPHRNNSDFHLRHFMAGSCFTPDGAWMLMYGQMIDREAVVKVCEAAKLKQEAKRLELMEIVDSQSAKEYEILKARAELLEMDAHKYTADTNLEAAKMELQTIKSIMAELEPQRKYAHLPLLEANEAAQRDEWLGEFKNRIENYLATIGTIPEDQLRAMRNHPDFATELLPHITSVMRALETSHNKLDLLANKSMSFLEAPKND